jgi:hypothetical protein
VGKYGLMRPLRGFFRVLPGTCGIKDFLARTTSDHDFFAVTPFSGHILSPLKTMELSPHNSIYN